MKLIYEVPVICRVDGEEDISLSSNERILAWTSDDWNQQFEVQWFGLTDEINITGTEMFFRDGKLFVSVLVDELEITGTMIIQILNSLEGQFSDGWGESFEQQPVEIDGEQVYISTWESVYDNPNPRKVRFVRKE